MSINFLSKQVVVFGAGRSGLAATNLLLQYGAEVILTDDASFEELPLLKAFDKIDHAKLTLKLCGDRPIISKDSCAALILSPGISYEHPLVKAALDQGISILNEIDLAYLFLGGCFKSPSALLKYSQAVMYDRIHSLPSRAFRLADGLLKQPLIIGITGTNGKSTTTVMLGQILKRTGFKVFFGGNLGEPLCSMIVNQPHNDFDYIVLELSSYQLEALHLINLDMAVILNITPDHLDRYGSLAHYQKAKLAIKKLLKPEGTLFIHEELASLLDDMNRVQFFNQGSLDLVQNLGVRGEHNRENALAAASCARALGVPDNLIKESLLNYKALPHRCELIAQKSGITFINDSKGTTVEAVKKALSMVEGPVQLLLGGLAKGDDFSELLPKAFPFIEGYHVYGQAKPKILSELSGAKTYAYENLSEAFKGALCHAKVGHTILLSPGCASFDQFTDFNARGEHFRSLVEALCA